MSTAVASDVLTRITTPRQRRVLDRLVEMANTGDRVEPLPSERVLAEDFDVSRPTIRAVLGSLEEVGYIRPHGVRGRRLCLPNDPSTDLPIRSETTGRTLLDNTVVLLTEHAAGEDEGTVNPASDRMIEAALLSRVRSLGGNAMALAPSTLTIETLRILVAQRPMAVVGLRDMSGFELSRQARERFVRAGVPLVVYGSDAQADASVRVGSDHQAGCGMLTDWLIERGCRRILPVWTGFSPDISSRPWIKEREIGYDAVCKRRDVASLTPVHLPLSGTNEAACGQPDAFDHAVRQIVGFLIDRITGPDAVDALIGTSDHHAVFLSEACRRLGVDPESDIMIVGYDHNLGATFDWQERQFRPAATIDKNNRQIGRVLAEEAFRVSRSSDSSFEQFQTEPRLVEPQLVVHG
ncbi:MAG: GntR family transcriptional regulator [Planctomycetota bacterium]